MKFYQQGDCLIKEVQEIPKGENSKDNVLVEGEHTGHAHRITNMENVVKTVVGTAIFLKVLHEVRVRHEEHKEILLPPGNYKIDQVNEDDHFEEEVRKVMD